MSMACDSDPTLSAVIYDLLHEARDSYELETRAEMRYPFCRLITVQIGDATYSALTREVSQSGMGLLHRGELPMAVAEVTVPTERGPLCARLQMRWCKRVGEGWFISGGEFLGRAEI